MKYSDLQNLMSKYGIYPKKSLGQNFLMDENILNKIIEAGEIKEGEKVLEIGPGLGFLTGKLIEKKSKVTALELDTGLIELLKHEHKEAEVINIDALKYDPPAGPYKIIANIPYYITSPLISHFLEAKNKPSKMVLLVQKEVAQKICAKEGDLNVLAIHVRIYGKPEIVAKVSRECFYPAPNVDSSIIKIDVFKKPLLENPENFIKVVHAGFAHKRKTLLNALMIGFSHLTPDQIKEKLKACQVPANERAQHLSIDDWKRLSKALT